VSASRDDQAPGHSGFRASDADRDRVVEDLKSAFVSGRLDRDEFDGRVGQALAAKTDVDLATLIADLPAELMRPAGAKRTGLPVPQVRVRQDLPVKAAAAAIVVGTDAVAFAVASSGAAPAMVLILLVLIAVGMTGTALVAALLAGLKLLLGTSSARSSGGQLPPSGGTDSGSPQPGPGAPVTRRGSRAVNCALTTA
jgi:hypothetical protein